MVCAKNKNLESICANVGVPEKGKYLKERRLFTRLGISKCGGQSLQQVCLGFGFVVVFFFLHVL